jgi:hypothetical protein
MSQKQRVTYNSHVQITKALLRAFSEKTDDGYKAWYLDYSDWQIKQEKIKVLGTQREYYSQEMEDFLKTEIEGKVGDVFKKIRDFCKQNIIDHISFDGVEIQNILHFFAYSMLRGKDVLKKTNDSSIFSQFIEGGFTAEHILRIPVPAINYFQEYCPTILKNQTETPFLIPFSCIYTAHQHCFPSKRPLWLLPISPKCSLMLYHLDDRKDHEGKCYIIDRSDVIDSLNAKAFHDEIVSGSNFLVGSKLELERLQDILQHDEHIRNLFNIQKVTNDK